MITTLRKSTSLVTLLALFAATAARADVECRGWGDVRAIRVNGDLLDLTTNLRMANPDESENVTLNNQARNARGTRVGNVQTFTGPLAFANGNGVNWRIQITDDAPPAADTQRRPDPDSLLGPATATFDIQATATADLALEGIYYWFNLPAADWLNGTAEVADAATTRIDLTDAALPDTRWEKGKTLKLTSGKRSLELTFPASTPILFKATRRQNQNQGRGNNTNAPPVLTTFSVAFPVGTGNLTRGQAAHITFTAKAALDNDRAPVKITLNPTQTGPAFVGIGGNFRLQSQADPAHIAYNLENLRVAWGRVAMPLNNWQTSATMDPIAAADAGQLNNQVRQAMEMARTLAQKKIPFIISDWSAPQWAVDAPPGGGRGPGGGGGGGIAARHIADEQWPAMYKGIVSYLVYLKKNYGAEPDLFSFNEADLGIDVHLTPEDQHLLIKELGAALQAAGLKTKMLLGDTSSPTPRPLTYLDPTLADPDALKFVGAVSFHSWNGASDQQLAYWGQTAQRLKLPLLVAEGGTDPDSYRFPALFLESWYSVDEMNLYLRCCALTQPTSILHWQLTENYSLLTSASRGAPLEPTQRFYNLKQLNLTPPEAPWIAATADRPHITVAAYGDSTHGYAIHLINTGASRDITVTGLPPSISTLRQVITNSRQSMKEGESLKVNNGTLSLTIDPQTYITLTTTP